jgi:MoaA/NifB/PqqE/SkfB family radical SAM enzyme
MKAHNKYIKYNVELIEDDISAYDTLLERRFGFEGKTKFSLPNAFKNGIPQLMNGLSILKFISSQDKSFENLRILQNKIQLLLNKNELRDLIYFLPEESWHVTVYDLDWEEGIQSSSIKDTFVKLYAKRLEELNTVFEKLDKPGIVNARIEGIGVSNTGCIVAKVHFIEKDDLNRILQIRSLIEAGTGKQLPDFAAHVSLGYLYRKLSDDELNDFFDVIRTVENVDCGLLAIDVISLVVYNKLTKFHSVLTKDLEEGTIAHPPFDVEHISSEGIATTEKAYSTVKQIRSKTRLLNHMGILADMKDSIRERIGEKGIELLKLHTKKNPFSYATIELHPTNVCNLDCLYCSYAGQKSNQTIPFEDLHYITGLRPQSITLAGGGEPTLYKSGNKTFSDMVKLLSETTTARIGLITNGSYFPKGDFVKYLDWVRVSCDAWSENTYRKIKQRDDLNAVKHNIKRYLDSEIATVGVGYLFQRDNCEEFPDFLLEMYRLNKKKLNIQQRPVHGNAVEKPTFDQLNWVISRMEQLMNTDSDFAEFVTIQTNYKQLIPAKEGKWPWHAGQKPKARSCYFSLLFLLINAKEECFPCRMFSENGAEKLGRLTDKPEEIKRKQIQRFLETPPLACMPTCLEDSLNVVTCNYIEDGNTAIEITPHLFI